MPGIYIDNCLVNVEMYECPVSVLNTMDKTVEITTFLVIIEEIEYDITAKILHKRIRAEGYNRLTSRTNLTTTAHRASK